MFKSLAVRPWPIALISVVAVVAIVSVLMIDPGPTCNPPTVDLIIDAAVYAGQNVPLVADIRGSFQSIEWVAERGSIANASVATTTYTAPSTGEDDTITLKIFYKSDCEPLVEMQSITFIAATPTPSATPSDTPTPTPPPSDTPTITHTPSETSTPSPTVPTPTPTTPPPSLALLEPKNATCVGLGQNVVFQWQYVRALNNIEGPDGEYFALDLWTTGTPKQSVAWIKQPQYIIDVANPVPVFLHFVDCQVESGCFWSVSVIRANRFPGQDPFEGDHTVLVSSSNRVFCTRGNLPPTATPTERPVATPTDTLAPP